MVEDQGLFTTNVRLCLPLIEAPSDRKVTSENLQFRGSLSYSPIWYPLRPLLCSVLLGLSSSTYIAYQIHSKIPNFFDSRSLQLRERCVGCRRRSWDLPLEEFGSSNCPAAIPLERGHCLYKQMIVVFYDYWNNFKTLFQNSKSVELIL